MCEVCGSDHDRSFEVHVEGAVPVFDSFECAIHGVAPRCEHCSCPIIGHGGQTGAARLVLCLLRERRRCRQVALAPEPPLGSEAPRQPGAFRSTADLSFR